MRQLLVWIRDHKLSTAGLVLVILGGLALVSLSRRVHHLNVRRPAAEGGTMPSPSGQAATEAVARSASMRGEFEDAHDYLDFIQQALGRPQEGGRFYALLAWKRCNDLDQHGAAAAADAASEAFHAAAVVAVEDLRKRCGGVLQAYADAAALYKVATQHRGGRDLLLPPDGRGIVAPAARETADADIDAALRTGDRWAAAEALRANAGFLDAGNSTGDDAADRQLRERAAAIVACELVGNCRGGFEASLHCVQTGDCAHDDYRDVVLADVPGAQRTIFDTMLAALHERVGLAPGVGKDDDKP